MVNNPPPSTPSSPLAQVLEDNRKTSSELKNTADELGVVHAVLDSTVPESARVGDVDAAIHRTEALEDKLNETSKQLDASNKALEQATRKLSGQR